uniref:CCHC-type domain-containing protein n=1 Tax=Biomphalaria glabrata TaxID=6526 RepID=A0A2C9LQZ2_BIOGL
MVSQTYGPSNFRHYRKHRNYMNFDLRKDNYEILIIYHDDDEQQVRHFKYLLEKNVRYKKYNGLAQPIVELLRDVQLEDEALTPELDFALSKTLLIFLFATESFVEDKWTVHQGRSSLEAAIKKNNTFPFIVYQGKQKNITLPAILASLKPLNFYDKESDNEGLYSDIRKVLESNVRVLLDKDKELSLRRRQFLKDKYPHLLEDQKPSTGHIHYTPDNCQDMNSKLLDRYVLAPRQTFVTNSNFQNNANNQTPSSSQTYQSKFRDFHPKEDTLENYLTQFEYIFRVYDMTSLRMTQQLLAKFRREPLHIINTLRDEQRKGYNTMKARLIEQFGKTEEYYRRIFRDVKVTKKGDTSRIIHHMRQNMLKLLQLPNCDFKDPKQMKDSFLIENALRNTTKGIFAFLEERKVGNEKELVANLKTYKDSHPNIPIEKRELAVKVKKENYSTLPNKYRYSRNMQCFFCGITGHTKAECRKRITPLQQSQNRNNRREKERNNRDLQWYSPNNNRETCKRQTRERSNNRPWQMYSPINNRRAYQNQTYKRRWKHINNNNNSRPRRTHFQRQLERQHNNHTTRENVPSVATEKWVETTNVAYVETKEAKLKLHHAFENSKVFTVRDRVCTSLIVEKSLIKPEQVLPEKVTQTHVKRDLFDVCEKALLYIESPWLTGEYTVIVMYNPADELINGNIEDTTELSERWGKRLRQENIRLASLAKAEAKLNDHNKKNRLYY